DVRLLLGDDVDGLGAGRRDARDRESFAFEQRAHAETHDRVILDREDPYARPALRRRLALGVSQKTEGIRGACRHWLLARFVRSPVPRHPYSDSRPRCGLDLRARLERRLAALLVFGMERED